MKPRTDIRLLTANAAFIFSALFFPAFVNGQSQLPHHSMQIAGGYSRHGSGDMNGIILGTEFVNYLSKKVSLNYNFRVNINNSKQTIIVTDNSTGSQKDASIRFTTAGVQLGVNGQYSLVRNIKHEFLISLGAFGRYQSASNGADGYSLYGPNVTGVPTILVGYDNTTPQKTYSFGGIIQLHYNFTFSNNIFIGVAPGFQTDTNGDALPQVALIAGRRF